MKAVMVHGAGDLRVQERATPEPGDGQVLLRIAYGGICGSDLSYFRHGAVGDFVLREPLVLGHEVVGTVAADPSGRLPAGAPVTVHPATTCGECELCRSGAANVCPKARYLGSAATMPHTQGGFAEYLLVRDDQVRRLPAGMPLQRGVLAEPLGVAVHGLARAGQLAGARVLVNGAGPIGLLTVGAAIEAGAAEVGVSDVLDRPLRLAEQLGATGTWRVDAEPLPQERFDVVIEASGVPAAIGGALAAVRRRGVFVQVGLLPGGPQPVALAALAAREIDMRGAFRFGTEIDRAVEMLAGTTRFDPVITQVFDVADASEAIAVAADPATSSKVVLRFGQ